MGAYMMEHSGVLLLHCAWWSADMGSAVTSLMNWITVNILCQAWLTQHLAFQFGGCLGPSGVNRDFSSRLPGWGGNISRVQACGDESR